MDSCWMFHENLPWKRRRNVFSDAFAVKKQLLEVLGAAPNRNHPDQLLYTCNRCYNKQLFTRFSRSDQITESDWPYKNRITSLRLDVAAVSPKKFQMKFVRGPSATSGLRTPERYYNVYNYEGLGSLSLSYQSFYNDSLYPSIFGFLYQILSFILRIYIYWYCLY